MQSKSISNNASVQISNLRTVNLTKLTDDQVLLPVDVVRRPLDGKMSGSAVTTFRQTRIPIVTTDNRS